MRSWIFPPQAGTLATASLFQISAPVPASSAHSRALPLPPSVPGSGSGAPKITASLVPILAYVALDWIPYAPQDPFPPQLQEPLSPAPLGEYRHLKLPPTASTPH